MEIGDEEVITLSEAADLLGLQRGTLVRQARRGVLKARMSGSVYLVTGAEVKRYQKEHMGKRGFASPDHPLHDKPRGGRSKKDV